MNRPIAAIHQHIDEHLDDHIGQIQGFLRQESVSSGSKSKVEACAKQLRDYFRKLGCAETQIVKTARHPGVWAYYDAGAPITIANYIMYDTQPVDPKTLSEWVAPPFAAQLVDDDRGQVIIARGAINSKGPTRAWLNALQSIIAVAGRPPVNIMFICEGEEELGSPHLPEIVTRYHEQLARASCLIEFDALQEEDGKVQVNLGYKGNVYFELACSSSARGRGSRREVHGSIRPILDSPVQHLVNALASFVGDDGNTAAIDGLAEDTHIWPEDRELIQALAQSAEEVDDLKRRNDVIAWPADLKDAETLLTRYLYGPNFNINGIQSGYTERGGAKTIVPPDAVSKVNIRLVPDQSPERVMEQVRAHLDRLGFGDIVIRAPEGIDANGKNYTGYTWSKTSIKESAVQAVLDVYRRHNVPVTIWPHSAGSTPKYLFTQPPLNLPAVSAGLGHGGREHSTNEYFVIRSRGPYGGLADFEKSCVDILYALAELPARSQASVGTINARRRGA